MTLPVTWRNFVAAANRACRTPLIDRLRRVTVTTGFGCRLPPGATGNSQLESGQSRRLAEWLKRVACGRSSAVRERLCTDIRQHRADRSRLSLRVIAISATKKGSIMVGAALLQRCWGDFQGRDLRGYLQTPIGETNEIWKIATGRFELVRLAGCAFSANRSS